jgi:curved DNA-binding protein CbpA
MTHYENLNLKPDATDAEIKRAYRNKARQHHPDKGGDETEFAKVSAAYEVLKDPERRLLYDATGQDRRPPIEIEVQNILMGGFNAALGQEQDIAIVEFVRKNVIESGKQIPAETTRLKTRKKKLAAKRKKVKSSGNNLVHMVIDAELKQIDINLEHLKHQAEVVKACLAALDKYEEDWEAPEPVMQYVTFHYGQGATGTI